MSDKELVVWGIHAGRMGEADSLFLKEKCIAVGWSEMGDLSDIKPDRKSFKDKVSKTYLKIKPGAIPNYAGQLFRFVHEMKVGDVIVYPSKRDRKIHIGRVKGNYKYTPSKMPFPNIKSVEWTRDVPRTNFSQGSLYEIGSALSLFQVKNYAEEFLDALEGKGEPKPVSQDETVAIVADEIEETTHDFILKRLSQEMKGYPLQEFIAHLLGIMGYHTRISQEGIDGGIDIIAHKDELGFEPPLIKVQVKSSSDNVGEPAVSALYGKVSTDEFGLFITLGMFTPPAQRFAQSKSNLRLIDGNGLVSLILEHYEQFESRYKGLLPLKRVYVPESIEEVEQ